MNLLTFINYKRIPLIIFYIVLFTVKGIIELIYQIQPNFLKTTPTLQQNLPLLMSDLVEKINKNGNKINNLRSSMIKNQF